MRKLSILFIVIAALTFTSTAFAANSTQNPPNGTVKHIVKANETLSHISSYYQVPLQQIISLNNLVNPNKLQIDQVLLIPAKNDINITNVPAKNTDSVPKEIPTEKYVVKAKDTLSSIARTYEISLDAIIVANKTINPNSLQIGQVINLPLSSKNISLASRSDNGRSRDNIEAEASTQADEEEDKETIDDLAAKVIDYAKEFLGCAYSYGADGPKSFDCSGFTMFVFKHFDIELPHNSASQAKEGSKVEQSDLIPGDLVFFKTSGDGISHVGLYIGKGDFIHASTGGRKVEITSLSETYYYNRYVTARRIL
ncbi:MAG: NlpC/P60 family protein [Dehalobacterium sp.]